MARTTEEKAKRARDGAEDAVYKPVRGSKKARSASNRKRPNAEQSLPQKELQKKKLPRRTSLRSAERRGNTNPFRKKIRLSSGGRSGKKSMSRQSPRTGGAPSAARATQG